MNFDFTDDQQAIKRTANELLAARFKPERVRELAEAGGYDDDAWKEMSELGWAGIFIDEEHGGQGLGIVELVILMEELGYALAPVPFLSNAAAGLALQFAGTDEQKERWLPGIASGEARDGRNAPRRRGAARPGRGLGRGDRADRLDGSTSVVEAAAAEIEPFETMDRTRRFARVRADGGEPLGGDCFAAGDRIATALAPRPSAWRRRRWRWLSSTPATASSSAGRSGRTRPCRTAARRCCWRSRAPLSRVLRGLVRRRRAGVARGGRLDGEGVLVGCRLAPAAPRSRCTAASASPGSTTCTST